MKLKRIKLKGPIPGELIYVPAVERHVPRLYTHYFVLSAISPCLSMDARSIRNSSGYKRIIEVGKMVKKGFLGEGAFKPLGEIMIIYGPSTRVAEELRSFNMLVTSDAHHGAVVDALNRCMSNLPRYSESLAVIGYIPLNHVFLYTPPACAEDVAFPVPPRSMIDECYVPRGSKLCTAGDAANPQILEVKAGAETGPEAGAVGMVAADDYYYYVVICSPILLKAW